MFFCSSFLFSIPNFILPLPQPVVPLVVFLRGIFFCKFGQKYICMVKQIKYSSLTKNETTQTTERTTIHLKRRKSLIPQQSSVLRRKFRKPFWQQFLFPLNVIFGNKQFEGHKNEPNEKKNSSKHIYAYKPSPFSYIGTSYFVLLALTALK